MFKFKKFILENGTILTSDILKLYIDAFWNEVFKALRSNEKDNIHLMLMIKVQFTDTSMGHRTLADLRVVNFADKDLFINYIIDCYYKSNNL